MSPANSAPRILPPNTVEAHIVPGVKGDVAQMIRSCQPPRNWMDEVPQKYIYRCIPMVAANTMGWELLNPVDAEISWAGGELNTDVTVKSEAHPFAAGSHFGSGLITWYVPFIFRTSPDLGLVVTGPANHERNDAVPLDAFIRTDWLPFPFTMNWRITQKQTTIHFSQGEAIARLYPFPLALLEETKLEIHHLESDPGFMVEVENWGKARAANVTKQQADAIKWQQGGEVPTGEGVWNSQYVRAKKHERGDFTPHQTVFKCAPPEDKR